MSITFFTFLKYFFLIFFKKLCFFLLNMVKEQDLWWIKCLPTTPKNVPRLTVEVWWSKLRKLMFNLLHSVSNQTVPADIVLVFVRAQPMLWWEQRRALVLTSKAQQGLSSQTQTVNKDEPVCCIGKRRQ